MERSTSTDRVPAAKPSPHGRFSPFWLTAVGGFLLWAAFPPIGLTWLGWLVPLPWLWLVERNKSRGWTAYVQIWLAGALPWLALLEGIRRAHPANNLGWLALSLYLGTYSPAFIAATRVSVHGAHVPLILAAPVIWTALEFVRGYLLTGFSMALLGHTQSEWTRLIQISDLFGAYGVSFVMMLIAACLMAMLPRGGARWKLWPAAVGATVLAAIFGYGEFRVQPDTRQVGQTALKVALLQGTRDKIFERNDELDLRTFNQYWRLMLQAKEQRPDLDLIVWPEAAFSALNPELRGGAPSTAPVEAKMSDSEFHARFEVGQRAFADRVSRAAEAVNRVWRNGEFQRDNVYLLVGAETLVFTPDSMLQYNSALLLDPQGKIANRYYKTHPVMFGEYIPFGDVWPWLYSLTPMRQGMARGDGPRVFTVKGFRISPSICFESTVPHLIRRHCNTFEREAGTAPDILVNVTDDGWFWGSTILDLQLACGVFRAVELRRPMLVAANTGISAAIDGNGRITGRGPKRQEHIVFADVARDHRSSQYCRSGDLPAILCLVASLVWVARGAWAKRRANSRELRAGKKALLALSSSLSALCYFPLTRP